MGDGNDDGALDDTPLNLTPSVSKKPRRRMSALGVTLAGIAALDDDDDDDAGASEAGTSGGGGGADTPSAKRSGVVIAFEEGARGAAEVLKEQVMTKMCSLCVLLFNLIFLWVNSTFLGIYLFLISKSPFLLNEIYF